MSGRRPAQLAGAVACSRPSAGLRSVAGQLPPRAAAPGVPQSRQSQLSLAGAVAGAAGAAAATRLRPAHHRCPRVGERRLHVQVRSGVDVYGRLLQKLDEFGEQARSSSAEPVVKVFAVSTSPRPSTPWTTKTQSEGTGTAFVIEHEGKLVLLTNAHVVADATYVEVKRAGDAQKYEATRLKLGHECDLALLGVEDDTFWEGLAPMQFGGMPHLQDEVTAVGYPEGGEGISVTQGVVSRIEVKNYAHSGRSLLAVQIDAAINPGNSGGPALNEAGEVIGVAFQNQVQSQNIGFVIPVPTITHFLKDVDPSNPIRCIGFCSMGVKYQNLDNEQLRASLGMGDERTGVYICSVSSAAKAFGMLQPGDVILDIDGHDIANDGTFLVGKKERLSLQHLIHLKYSGEEAKVKILREGAELDLAVPVQPLPQLVPATLYDEKQPYFLYGGLAFVPLSKPYLQEWGRDWLSDAPSELIQLYLQNEVTTPGEQPVVLCHCFPTRRTAGYSSLIDQRVLKVNGEQVVNLRQMFELVQRHHAAGGFVRLELQSRGGDQILAIEAKTADEVTRSIMKTYKVPHMASEEFREEEDCQVPA